MSTLKIYTHCVAVQRRTATQLYVIVPIDNNGKYPVAYNLASASAVFCVDVRRRTQCERGL